MSLRYILLPEPAFRSQKPFAFEEMLFLVIIWLAAVDANSPIAAPALFVIVLLTIMQESPLTSIALRAAPESITMLSLKVVFSALS